MNDYLVQLRELGSQFLERVLALPRGIQAALVVVLVAFFGTILFFLFGRSTQTYVSLFEEEIELSRAADIIEKIKGEGFNYQTENGGKKIMVPASDMTRITLKLAELKALPDNTRIGWRELIDNRSLLGGITNAEFELNFIRGLQTELENGIRQLGPIQNAKVYISKPKEALFKSEQKPSTATVMVRIKPGRDLARDQVAALRNLVKGAVVGLQIENITIVDTAGRDLSRALDEEENLDAKEDLDWKYQMRRRTERDLEDKLKSMLDGVLGHNRTQVRITASLDFDLLEGARNKIVPLEGKIHGALVSMKTESEEFKGENRMVAGEPGVNSNTPPGAPSYPSDKNQGKDEYNRDAIIENYENSVIKESFKKNTGEIKNLSISVICDWQGSEEDKENISKISKTAVGFIKDRGDTFAFFTYPFSRDSENQMLQDIEAQKSEERLMLYSVIGLLSLLPLAILVIYLILRTLKQREIYRAQMEEVKKKEEDAKRKVDEDRRRQDALFPEALSDPEKQRSIQKLKLKAFRYAAQAEDLPDNFDELTPEEQELYKMAFKAKRDGILDGEIQKIEKIIGEMDLAIKEQRAFDLNELKKRAEEKKGLEERIRDLVEARPDDVARVVRSWLEED